MAGKEAENWAAWVAHLAQRNNPKPLTELLEASRSPFQWALPDGLHSEELCRQIAEARPSGAKGCQSPDEMLNAWRQKLAAVRAPDERLGLEAVSWCHALPHLAAAATADVWWGLLEQLAAVAAAAVAAAVEHDSDPATGQSNGNPWLGQVLAGELPLSLAYLFPEIVPCRELQAAAHEVLSAGLVDLLDGEGLPHGRHLGLMRPLLACWTRCRAMGHGIAGGCWTDEAQVQYEWLVRHAIRLSRRDGRQTLSGDGQAGGWCEELFQAALRLGGDEDDRDLASLLLPRRKKAAAAVNMALPETATHSEWAAAAVLRPGWRPSDPQLTVVYPDGVVRMELHVDRDVVWSGPWEVDVRRDGRSLGQPAEWTEVCWISDESVDYLELEGELADGLRVQRHVVLAREDQFLLLADAVMGDRPGRLEYCGVLPLAAGATFTPATETYEGVLAGGKPRARVLPLALPEWRIDPRPGALERTARGLELRQTAQGRALLAPLFVDLQPKRFRRPFTWRQLTVAANLAVQPAEVAAGYRVAIGDEQWLIYRALAGQANRTLLGHNLSGEFLVAQFSGEGKVETLVETE